jgi:hypothetical protein
MCCNGKSTEICAFVWEAVPGTGQIGHHQVNARACTRLCGSQRQIGLRQWRALPEVKALDAGAPDAQDARKSGSTANAL